jgi:hypothetical protein
MPNTDFSIKLDFTLEMYLLKSIRPVVLSTIESKLFSIVLAELCFLADS